MDSDAADRTRRQLHGVIETLIAGPQFRSHGTIRLGVVPGGVGGVSVPVRIEGADLVWETGRTPLTGTCRDVAAIAGIDAGPPEGVYKDLTEWSLDEPLDIDPDIAAEALEWFRIGDAALRAFAPEEVPVLWPEHFDLSVVVGEANYGVSPGDDFHGKPYAYVGPWTPHTGEFWNAPFGSYLSSDSVGNVDALIEYFIKGRELLET